MGKRIGMKSSDLGEKVDEFENRNIANRYRTNKFNEDSNRVKINLILLQLTNDYSFVMKYILKQ